ncbi:MAG: hypothetical protein NC223_09420 [Butyrivibrio sp.]|nr:hypothetical protein [Butyrivibrio sp.]
MLKRFFGFSLVKLILWIETAVSIVVFTNLWTLVDKYYDWKQAESKGLDYNYVACFDIYSDMEYQEYRQDEEAAELRIKAFIEDLRSLGGNVSIYPIAGSIGEGDKALYTLYLSADEDLPVAMEGKHKDFCTNAGVYVGNYNVNYIKDNVLSIFSDQMDVIGIMASYGFEKNEFIYVKYDELSEISRREAVKYISEDVYLSESFTVRAESNFITEEEYRRRFEDIIGGYSSLLYENGDTGAVETAFSYATVYRSIKYVFLGFAVFMCAGLLFQMMQLYLYNERENILIKKTYGMKEGRIFLPIFAQISVIYVCAVLLALTAETVIYHFAARYDLTFILKSLAAAAAASAVLELLVLAAAYLKFRMTGKSLASRLSSVEE